MSVIRKLSLFCIAVITSLNAFGQERGAQVSTSAVKEALRFHNLVAKKSIDIGAFKASPQTQLHSVNPRMLNLDQKAISKRSAADLEPSATLQFGKPVSNRLGDIQPLKIKTDKGMGYKHNRAASLRSFDFTSSDKRDFSDVN